MLNKLITALLFVIVAVPVSAQVNSPDEVAVPTDNRPVPIPWGLAQPFPWTDVQGLWKVEQDNYTTYFSLKVIKQKQSVNHLEIKQYDGETCRILTRGVGIERGNRVLAQMSARGETYRVQFTVFSEDDLRWAKLKSESPYDGIMVLSMGALDSPEMTHIQIARISPFISQKFCREDLKSTNY